MGLLLEQYVRDNPAFFKVDDPLLEIKQQVFNQSARHLIRDFKSSLISDKRPFESDTYTAYREKNRRRITADGIIQFEQMLIKALKQTSHDTKTLPKLLQSNLETKPYRFMNTFVDLDTWIFKVLVPYSFLDANAITIELPVNDLNPFIPPIFTPEEGGVEPTEALSIKTKIIPFDEWNIIKGQNYNFLIIKMLKEYPIVIDGEIKMKDYFFIADDIDWYLYFPVREEQGELIYNLIKWYPHDYEALPFSFIPGVNTLSVELHYYQESFCKTYLEWADEFLVRFQDDQIVHTRYAYPREIVDGDPCNECNGQGSRLMPGFMKNDQRVRCGACNGTGKMVSESISGRIFRSKDMLGTDKKEPIAFVTPDVGILSHTTSNAFFFLEEGRKSLGLDTLNPNIQEAEETKKIREQYKIDKLLNYSYGIVQWKEKHLNQKIALLDNNAPKIILPLPLSIAIKGEEALKEEIKNSLQVDRFYTTKKYIQEKYNNDPIKQRTHILALLYAPFLMLEESEITFRITTGAYDERDLIRADKAVYAFEQLIDDPGFMTKDDEMLIKAEEIVMVFFNNNINNDS